MKLDEIAESLLVQRLAPALAEAAGAVGGPHHRAMGTLGGNVCLDTRCRYYNQTYFWRKALGYCLKKDGTVCHVVKGGAKCVAAASNDSAPALIALDAEIRMLGRSGERRVPARDFYTADGIKNTVLEPGEIVVRVAVPVVPGRRSAFEKLRKRGAIDFPLLSVAARVDADAAGATHRGRRGGVGPAAPGRGASGRRPRWAVPARRARATRRDARAGGLLGVQAADEPRRRGRVAARDGAGACCGEGGRPSHRLSSACSGRRIAARRKGCTRPREAPR